MQDMNKMEESVSKKIPDGRKYLRDPIIVFKIREETDREYFFGYAKNISRGGLFIASINPRPPGETFHITFQIPGTEIKVDCQCEVVWTRPYDSKIKLDPGYGIRFLDLPEETAKAIDYWVKER